MSSGFESAAKATLLATSLVVAGAALGALLSLAVAPKRRRRERAFTEEDTTALAFHIARLTQQLAAQNGGALRRADADSGAAARERAAASQLVSDRITKTDVAYGTVVELPEETESEESDAAEQSRQARLSTSERRRSSSRASHVSVAEALLDRAAQPAEFRRNDQIDSVADVLNVYRQQYQNWRRGRAEGAKSSHERLLTRNFRSMTEGDPNDLPEIRGLHHGRDAVAAHLWQRLNLGPSTSMRKIKITVIGGGAFGTAMAAAAGRNGHNVIIYLRKREAAREIKLTHRNEYYLPGLDLPHTVSATINLKEALEGTELIIHALPAQKSPAWIAENRDLIPAGALYCSTAKGLHLESQSLLSEAMLKAFGRDQPFAVLSGPSFAKEIVTEQPTSVVVASRRLADAVKVQRVMSSTSFRIYASQDTVGVELGGALKNPLALGAGMIEGLGFGINTMSAYVTRSCAELTSLSVAMGGRPETVAGLSGIGDLMLTAFGSLSRNRSCGIRLVKGESLDEILATTTVEGVPTAKVAVAFAAQCNLHLPIFQTVCDIISGKLKPEDFVVTAIMQRPLTMETHTTPLSEVGPNA